MANITQIMFVLSCGVYIILGNVVSVRVALYCWWYWMRFPILYRRIWTLDICLLRIPTCQQWNKRIVLLGDNSDLMNSLKSQSLAKTQATSLASFRLPAKALSNVSSSTGFKVPGWIFVGLHTKVFCVMFAMHLACASCKEGKRQPMN